MIKFDKKYLIGMMVIVLLVLYVAFGDTKKEKKLSYEKKQTLLFPKVDLVDDADMVFRRGYGVDSTVAMNFSEGEKRYSHAGIVVREDNEIYVIHSEEDEDNHQNGVSKETLHDFLSGVPIWSVYRFELPKETKKQIVKNAKLLSKSQIVFDNDFDLDEDKKMYCSGFVYKTVNRSAGKEIIHAGKRFMSRTFVTISDLYENHYAKLVQSSHKKLKD